MSGYQPVLHERRVAPRSAAVTRNHGNRHEDCDYPPEDLQYWVCRHQQQQGAKKYHQYSANGATRQVLESPTSCQSPPNIHFRCRRNHTEENRPPIPFHCRRGNASSKSTPNTIRMNRPLPGDAPPLTRATPYRRRSVPPAALPRSHKHRFRPPPESSLALGT